MIAIKKGSMIRCTDCNAFAYKAIVNIYYGEPLTEFNLARLSGNKVFNGEVPHCEKCKTSVEIENPSQWSK